MMNKIKVAIVGAGNIARIRTKALLKTESVELCGVAAQHIESAQAFAREFDIAFATFNYAELSNLNPDVLLIEVPHNVQDTVVLWGLDNKFDILIGGPLATSSSVANRIIEMSQYNNCIVESGCEARYKLCWRDVKQQLAANSIGTPVSVNAIALWEPPMGSWYTIQDESGGMPVTHMTYAFINPLRWLFGYPIHISAMCHSSSELLSAYNLNEVFCITNLQFENKLLVSLVAGYIDTVAKEQWKLEFIGTEGVLEVYPGDLDDGYTVLHRKGTLPVKKTFPAEKTAFDLQAEAFINAIKESSKNRITSSLCLNPPGDSIFDLTLAESIIRSASQVIKPRI